MILTIHFSKRSKVTNGDMIKSLFPELKINETNKGFVLIQSETENISIWNNWWNAPYELKGETHVES